MRSQGSITLSELPSSRWQETGSVFELCKKKNRKISQTLCSTLITSNFALELVARIVTREEMFEYLVGSGGKVAGEILEGMIVKHVK